MCFVFDQTHIASLNDGSDSDNLEREEDADIIIWITIMNPSFHEH